MRLVIFHYELHDPCMVLRSCLQSLSKQKGFIFHTWNNKCIIFPCLKYNWTLHKWHTSYISLYTIWCSTPLDLGLSILRENVILPFHFILFSFCLLLVFAAAWMRIFFTITVKIENKVAYIKHLHQSALTLVYILPKEAIWYFLAFYPHRKFERNITKK